MDTPSMRPIFLSELEASGAARVAGRRVAFVIQKRWCAPGEDRLGYAGVVRLMECVRELHWRQDVSPVSAEVDTITKSLELEFLQPLVAGSEVTGGYAVMEIGPRSYALEVVFQDSGSSRDLARGRLVSVFYDGPRRRVVDPPPPLAAALRATEVPHRNAEPA